MVTFEKEKVTLSLNSRSMSAAATSPWPESDDSLRVKTEDDDLSFIPRDGYPVISTGPSPSSSSMSKRKIDNDVSQSPSYQGPASKRPRPDHSVKEEPVVARVVDDREDPEFYFSLVTLKVRTFPSTQT